MLRHLVTPWHESFSFSKEARGRIPRRTLDRILELNRLDAQLWDLGDRLLTVGMGAGVHLVLAYWLGMYTCMWCLQTADVHTSAGGECGAWVREFEVQ